MSIIIPQIKQLYLPQSQRTVVTSWAALAGGRDGGEAGDGGTQGAGTPHAAPLTLAHRAAVRLHVRLPVHQLTAIHAAACTDKHRHSDTRFRTPFRYQI